MPSAPKMKAARTGTRAATPTTKKAARKLKPAFDVSARVETYTQAFNAAARSERHTLALTFLRDLVVGGADVVVAGLTHPNLNPETISPVAMHILQVLPHLNLSPAQACQVLNSKTGAYLGAQAPQETLAYLTQAGLDPAQACQVLNSKTGAYLGAQAPQETLAYLQSQPLTGAQIREIQKRIAGDLGNRIATKLNNHAMAVEVAELTRSLPPRAAVPAPAPGA